MASEMKLTAIKLGGAFAIAVSEIEDVPPRPFAAHEHFSKQAR